MISSLISIILNTCNFLSLTIYDINLYSEPNDMGVISDIKDEVTVSFEYDIVLHTSEL